MIELKPWILGIIFCFLCIQNGHGYCVSLQKCCRSNLDSKSLKSIKKTFSENNIIALKQQLVGIILAFFAFKMAVAIVFLRENAVEAV